MLVTLFESSLSIYNIIRKSTVYMIHDELDAKVIVLILISHVALYDSYHPCSALIFDYRALLQSFEETNI